MYIRNNTCMNITILPKSGLTGTHEPQITQQLQTPENTTDTIKPQRTQQLQTPENTPDTNKPQRTQHVQVHTNPRERTQQVYMNPREHEYTRTQKITNPRGHNMYRYTRTQENVHNRYIWTPENTSTHEPKKSYKPQVMLQWSVYIKY